MELLFHVLFNLDIRQEVGSLDASWTNAVYSQFLCLHGWVHSLPIE